jgi:hypothetical protein
MSNIKNLKEINWDNVKLAKSGRAIKLLYEKEPLQFCTSTLYTPFGVKFVSKDWSNFTEFSIDCSLNQAQNESSVGFREFIEELDCKINSLVKDNLNLFNSTKEVATDNYNYSSILRENGTYPKLIKLQFPRDKNGNFTTFFFDANKDKLKLDESNIEATLTKGQTFKCIIECSKIWYYNNKVGSIWNVIQLKICETKTKNTMSISNEENSNQSVYNIYNTMLIDD